MTFKTYNNKIGDIHDSKNNRKTSGLHNISKLYQQLFCHSSSKSYVNIASLEISD